MARSKSKQIKKATKVAMKQTKNKNEKRAIKKAGKKAVKEQKKKDGKNLGGRLSKGLKKAVGKGKDLAFSPLLPFKPVMVMALKKRNIAHTKGLSDIVPKFYQHIVKNSFDSSNNQNYYADGVNLILEEHIDGEKQEKGAGELAVGAAGKAATGNYIAAGAQLVKAVLTYVRKLKDKKDKAEAQEKAGQPVTDPLTDAEKEVVKGSEEVASELKEVNEEDIANEKSGGLGSIKEFIFSTKGMIIIGVLLGAIAFFFLRKKK